MSSTQFVEMYHPALGNRQATVPLQAVDDYAATGWLLVDPDAVLPDPVTPYYTTAAADSRFIRDTQLATKMAGHVGDGSAFDLAQRAAFGLASQLTATGSTTTADINTWLATPSPFRVKRLVGAVTIDAPLVVPSGTYFDCTDATITQAHGAPRNMLRNAAVTAARTVCDLGITAGSTSVTSATAAFAAGDVGKAVRVYEGDIGKPMLTDATIASVTNATTAVLSKQMTLTGTGKGMSIGTRDTDITIVGGHWIRDSDQSMAAETLNSHSMLLRRVDDLLLRDVTFSVAAGNSGGKYQVHLADSDGFRIERVRFTNVPSDGVHLGGLCFDGKLRDIAGYTGDDLTAITAADYMQFNDVYGDVADIEFTDISVEGNSPTSSQLFRAALICNNASGQPTTTRVRRIRGRKLRCTRPDWPIISLVTGGVDDVVFEDCVGIYSLGSPLADEPNRVNRVAIRRHTVLDNYGTGVFIQNGCPVGELVLEDCSWVFPGAGGMSAVYMFSGSSIEHLALRNITATGPKITMVDMEANTSIAAVSADTVHIVGSDYTGGRLLNQTTGTSAIGRARLVDCRAKLAQWVLNLNTPITVEAFGCDFADSVAAVRVVGTTAVDLRAEGGEWSATATGGMELHSLSTGARIDVSQLAKRNGDMAYNTNAGLSCGVGPVVCDGTTWKHLHTGATYS